MLTKPWVVMPAVAIIGLGAWTAYQSQSSASGSPVQTTDQTVAASSGTIAQTVSAQGTVKAAADRRPELHVVGDGDGGERQGRPEGRRRRRARRDRPDRAASRVSRRRSSLAQAEAKLSDDEDADASDAQLAADEPRVVVGAGQARLPRRRRSTARNSSPRSTAPCRRSTSPSASNSAAAARAGLDHDRQPEPVGRLELGPRDRVLRTRTRAQLQQQLEQQQLDAARRPTSRSSPRRRSPWTSASTATTSARSRSVRRRRSRCPLRSGNQLRRLLPRRRLFPGGGQRRPAGANTANAKRRRGRQLDHGDRHVERDRHGDRGRLGR